MASARFCTVVLVRVEKCMLSFLRKHRNETDTHGTQHQSPMDGIHFDPNCTRRELSERWAGHVPGRSSARVPHKRKRTRSESLFGVTHRVMGVPFGVEVTYSREASLDAENPPKTLPAVGGLWVGSFTKE